MLDGAEEPVPARTSLVRPKAQEGSMEDAAAARRILFSRAVLTDLQGKREEEKGRGVDEGLLEGLLDAAGAAAADADVPDCDEGVEDALLKDAGCQSLPLVSNAWEVEGACLEEVERVVRLLQRRQQLCRRVLPARWRPSRSACRELRFGNSGDFG